ncbi:MAG: hypothetical protein ACO2ER_07975 [Castellaniella sp.]
MNDVAAIIGDDDRPRRIEMRQMTIIAQAGFPLQAALAGPARAWSRTTTKTASQLMAQ